MRKLVALFFLACLPLCAQGTGGSAGVGGKAGWGGGTSAAPATPGFVSSNISGSTVDSQVTTLVSGTVTCAGDAFCTWYVDPTLAGNSGVIFVTYGAASSEVPTVTDDKSNTYTHASCEANDSTNNRWGEVFYSIGLATGTRAITVTFPAAVTHAQVHVYQLYNIGSFDACSENASGSSVTAFAAGNLTTTASNDWAGVFTVQTNPTNTFTTQNALGPFAAAGGWSQTSNNIRDGEASAFETVSSASTITPTITSSASAAYVGVAIAMKSNTSGTAPSGMYVACMGASNSATATNVTPISEGTPCPVGNLIYIGAGGGASNANVQTSSISDGTNTWTQCGSSVLTAGNQWEGAWFASNATIGNGTTPAVNVNWQSGTGDLSYWWWVVVGASTTAGCAAGNAGLEGSNGATGSTYTITTNYQAYASSSITIGSGAWADNTPISLVAPGTAFDANFNGGETLNGPWPLDQNNFRWHYYQTDTTPVLSNTYGLANSTTSPGSFGYRISSFPAPGALWIKDNWVSGEATSGTSETVNITPTVAAPLIVGVDIYASPAVTINAVCLDGNSTCGTGTALTVVPSSTSVGVSGSQGATAIYYTGSAGSLSTVTATAHTITVVASSTVGHLDVVVYPVIGITAVDLGDHTQNGSESGGTVSGPSITTTGNPGFALAVMSVSQTVTAAPSSGNEYTFGSGIFPSADCWAALISTSATGHSPSCTDSTGTFNSSNAAFK